jgi:germination protein M
MTTKSRKTGKLARWSALLLLLPLLTACNLGLGKTGGNAAGIDPPPADIEQAMLSNVEESAWAAGNDRITVYLLDRNGYLAPMSLREEPTASQSSAIAERAIGWMTVNKQLASQLPPGFTAVLPEGTKVSAVTENTPERTISVDFKAPFPGIAASRERKVIEALVWTLTELPGIDKVELSVGGKPIRSLPSSGLPVDIVLTRGMGINLEKAKNVEPSHAMGVTLYFSSQSAEGEGYFVPVTRLIKRQADSAKAALEQLILGPRDTQALHATLAPGMAIEKLSLLADTVNVSLQDDSQISQSPVPAMMMESLVLTLTEATGAPQVSVVMNGDDSLIDSEQRSYSRPVSRPLYVNPTPQY